MQYWNENQWADWNNELARQSDVLMACINDTHPRRVWE